MAKRIIERIDRKMEVWLTDGMFGKKIEQVIQTNDANIAIDACILWKSRANPEKYRIAKYNRYIFEKNDNVAIDFGDYSSFLLITGKNACEAVHNALYRKT